MRNRNLLRCNIFVTNWCLRSRTVPGFAGLIKQINTIKECYRNESDLFPSIIVAYKLLFYDTINARQFFSKYYHVH